ncbi:MAG: hypothetical protein WAK17_28095 [Candidatus Nitrosopolaris sp.]
MPLQQRATEGDDLTRPLWLGETMANGTTLEAVAAPFARRSFMIPGKSCSRMGKAVASNACA